MQGKRGLAAKKPVWQAAPMRNLLASLLLLLAVSPPAHADGVLDSRLTPTDKQRLDGFDATLKDALAEARAGGNAEDVKLLDEALAGEPLPLAEGYDAEGNWRCRTIKAGGSLPLTVYPWFKCRINDDGAGWKLEKLTGSQRTTGRFYTLSATRLAYLGAGHYHYEEPRAYGSTAEHDQVAIAERRAKNRIILLFPAPKLESKLDLLVLER